MPNRKSCLCIMLFFYLSSSMLSSNCLYSSGGICCDQGYTSLLQKSTHSEHFGVSSDRSLHQTNGFPITKPDIADSPTVADYNGTQLVCKACNSKYLDNGDCVDACPTEEFYPSGLDVTGRSCEPCEADCNLCKNIS